ncbi:MAG TPA: hypothetical protein VGK04_05965 [Thermoanaerobaculia bacterium]|jgi:hypothetical protein
MTVIDYNGDGRWSKDAIIERYGEHARRFGVAARDLSPAEHHAEGRLWVYPVMDRVIEGVEAGDPASAEIATEFIEEDASFPFGRILKSNAARALRRCAELTEGQRERIRLRVLAMLVSEYLPREFRQYAKLARKSAFSLSCASGETR